MPALAHFIAGNALPLLAGLIVLVGLLTIVLWRLGERRQTATPMPVLRLALCTAAVFVTVATQLDGIGIFDALLAEELRRTISLPTLQTFLAITRFGNFLTLLMVVIGAALALALRRRWLELAAWLAATVGNGLLNRFLKQLFARERPLFEHGLLVEPSFSFPSGHASGSLAVYGMLSWLLIRWLPVAARLPTAMAAAAAILLIGFSRVILQVHYFSDVIAGFASAATWLCLCIAVTERLRRRQTDRLMPARP